PRVNFSFDKKNKWKSGHFFIGPVYSFRLGKKFVMDVKALGGVFMLRKPGYNFHYKDSGGLDHDFSYQSGNGSRAGIDIGLSARYPLSKKLALKFNIDYIRSTTKVTYDVKITEPFYSNPSAPPSGTVERLVANYITQNVRVLNIGLGLVFQLER
ncbi:MAG: hypothetical protein K2X86_16950, partial [Cytophagaceae bacterium]|nr:hypothetical protein [Cytophagaceae bacterium]